MPDLPQIDHIYARLRGSQIFSTFDLRSGYHHLGCLEPSPIEMNEIVQEKCDDIGEENERENGTVSGGPS